MNRNQPSKSAKLELSDCNSAIRFAPDSTSALVCRAECYLALGQPEKAQADARRILQLNDLPTTNFWRYPSRIAAFQILAQPQESVGEVLQLFRTQGLRDWVPVLERTFEGGRRADVAFVLAMARWKLGEKDVARRWYEKGVQWMGEQKGKYLYGEETTLRSRAEAAALLGSADKPSAGKEKGEKGK